MGALGEGLLVGSWGGGSCTLYVQALCTPLRGGVHTPGPRPLHMKTLKNQPLVSDEGSSD